MKLIKFDQKNVNPFNNSEAEKTKEYWTEIAAVELKSAIESQKLNTNVAKNVILFLGKLIQLVQPWQLCYEAYLVCDCYKMSTGY